MDVTVLRKAMTKFGDMFELTNGFRPHEHCSTLPSACMTSYRKNFLPWNKLQISTQSGRRQTSYKAQLWLAWLQHDTGKRIRTADSSGGEHKIVCGSKYVHVYVWHALIFAHHHHHCRTFYVDGAEHAPGTDGEPVLTAVYEFLGLVKYLTVGLELLH